MLSGQVAALGAAARTSREIPVSTGDVLIFGIAAASTGSFRMNFTPSDTGQKYASDVVPSTIISGTAQAPFRLDGGAGSIYHKAIATKSLEELFAAVPGAVFIKNASTITLDVQDTSGAPNTIDVGFIGFRIRP
jgi:hypothetical protein